MDFSSTEDLQRLLYCAHLVAKPTECPTYEIFAKVIEQNGRLYAQAMSSLVKYNEVAAQFSEVTKVSSGVELSAENPPKEATLGAVVARLVVEGGVDARYALREMSVEDMLLFVKALDDKQRQTAESQRLWTFIQVAPHIDQKKTPSPQKLYPFPWEIEENERKAKALVNEMRDEFVQFMTGKNNGK